MIDKLGLRTMKNGQPSRSGEGGRIAKRQLRAEAPHTSSPIPHITDTRPPKRPRNENSEVDTNGNRPTSANHLDTPGPASASKSSRTSSIVPESPEWMRTRITQLESDLESARAGRDLAESEQRVAAIAHQAEQQARREAMLQKSAAEAAQFRAEAEQLRLQSELESIISQKSMPLREEDVSVSHRSPEHVKLLERDLEETQDREHKLQLRTSHLESELEKAKSSIAQADKANAEIAQLKSELASTQEQLNSTQLSLESLERKYSSKRRKYESLKEKLGTYKSRLENERSLVKKLQETLTPAAYKSLGATHETLGAFLSAMGLPQVGSEGSSGPKEEESD